MTDTYRTVADRGEERFEIRGSTFIGHVSPANSTSKAEAFVEAIRDAYDDATHNVPAYRVPAGETAGTGPGTREPMLREYAGDAGEPTGSAGKPALNVLQQRDLRRIVAVVTRYYGGTNLGVGGLARAYSRAVTDAVDNAGVTEQRPHEQFEVHVAYDDSGTVRAVLESVGVTFDADYGEAVTFEVRLPVAEADDLKDRLRSATSGRVRIE
jgi:uncharacterized YigZ family protein